MQATLTVKAIKEILKIGTNSAYTQKNKDIEREAVGSITAYMSMYSLENATSLNGAKRRAKLADIPLPDFSKRAPTV